MKRTSPTFGDGVIRSYLSTCQKNGVGAGETLSLLFRGRWPPFIRDLLDDELEGAE